MSTEEEVNGIKMKIKMMIKTGSWKTINGDQGSISLDHPAHEPSLKNVWLEGLLRRRLSMRMRQSSTTTPPSAYPSLRMISKMWS